MKYFKVAGLCLASMLVMGMAGASSASAVVWEACLEKTSTTRYSALNCEKAMAGGEWGWEELTTTDKVVSVAFTISLTDTGATGGSSTVVCTAGGRNSGTVGPGRFDRIELARVEKAEENCRATSGGCKTTNVEVVEGINLPWQTEVFETEKKFLTKIEGTTGKEPGWKVRCNTLIGKMTDECTTPKGEPEAVELLNVQSERQNKLEQLVLATFEKKVKSECTQSKAKTGSILGVSAILLANANNEPSERGLKLK